MMSVNTRVHCTESAASVNTALCLANSTVAASTQTRHERAAQVGYWGPLVSWGAATRRSADLYTS
jgi:hypothetical protein